MTFLRVEILFYIYELCKLPNKILLKAFFKISLIFKFWNLYPIESLKLYITKFWNSKVDHDVYLIKYICMYLKYTFLYWSQNYI